MTKKHFPAAFFPITSEQDLISKVYIVLAIGQSSHGRGRHYVPSVDAIRELGVSLDDVKRTQPELFGLTEPTSS